VNWNCTPVLKLVCGSHWTQGKKKEKRKKQPIGTSGIYHTAAAPRKVPVLLAYVELPSVKRRANPQVKKSSRRDNNGKETPLS